MQPEHNHIYDSSTKTYAVDTHKWASAWQNLQKDLFDQQRIRSTFACYILQAIQRDKQEPLPYWVDVKVDLSHCWPHRSYCRFCCVLAQIFLWRKKKKKMSGYPTYQELLKLFTWSGENALFTWSAENTLFTWSAENAFFTWSAENTVLLGVLRIHFYLECWEYTFYLECWEYRCVLTDNEVWLTISQILTIMILSLSEIFLSWYNHYRGSNITMHQDKPFTWSAENTHVYWQTVK